MESINKLANAPNVRPTHQAIMTLHGEQQANRKFMIGGLFLIIAFSAATFGLTLGAAEFSKESKVNNGMLVSASDMDKPITVQAHCIGAGTDKNFNWLGKCRSDADCYWGCGKNPGDCYCSPAAYDTCVDPTSGSGSGSGSGFCADCDGTKDISGIYSTISDLKLFGVGAGEEFDLSSVSLDSPSVSFTASGDEKTQTLKCSLKTDNKMGITTEVGASHVIGKGVASDISSVYFQGTLQVTEKLDIYGKTTGMAEWGGSVSGSYEYGGKYTLCEDDSGLERWLNKYVDEITVYGKDNYGGGAQSFGIKIGKRF